MALAVDAAGRITANPQTGHVNQQKKPVLENVLQAIGEAFSSAPSDLSYQMSPNAPVSITESPVQKRQTQQAQATIPISAPSGLANSTGNTAEMAYPSSLLDAVTPKNMLGVDPTFKTDDQVNEEYEKAFRDAGAPDDLFARVDKKKGNWWENAESPQTEKGRSMLGSSSSNPDMYVDMSMAGDPYAVDNGKTYDYNHLTAPRATGAAMQEYGEMGMGGRGWWLYDPNRIYLKNDERDDFGFRPYQPDDTSKLNSMTTQFADAWGDVAGALGSSRQLLTDYGMTYGEGDDRKTISGSDFDYRASPYLSNMMNIIRSNPATLLSMPENGELHGAPVSTVVLENELKDADGSTRYLYGSLVEDLIGQDLIFEYPNGDVITVPSTEWRRWQTNENNQPIPPSEYDGASSVDYDRSNVRMPFSDGQSVNIPITEYEKLQKDIQEGKRNLGEYVPIEEAHGFLPDDIDALNDDARKNVNERGLAGAPVLYMPDLVMEDGSRIPYFSVQDIAYDQNDGSKDVSYDFGPLGLGKPRRLTGNVFNENSSLNIPDLFNNAYDFTMGSLPLAVDKIAWPLSIMQATKSISGIDPNKYDPMTGSDAYIAAEYNPDTGSIEPTYTPTQQKLNAAMSALVPLTEQLAGPISGHSFIEKLSGKVPANPTKAQVLQGFGLGALGEGMEEIVGNLFDEAGDQGEGMFGHVTNDKGERLLDDSGQPVRDENGNYKFVDANGNPFTYMTDETGHIYKDTSTPFFNRIMNFANPNDLLNAFSGGALVDTTMELFPPNSLLGRLARAHQGDRIRSNTGVRQYVETNKERALMDALENGVSPDLSQYEVELDPRFNDYFSHQLRHD